VLTPQDPSVAENAGTVTFTVTRTGGTDGAVSVSYATSNLTAVAGSDYVATSGTLNFADGQATQTFSVTINDDSVDEPDEAFDVSLNNPTGGATLGDSSSRVTIRDNDLPGPGNASVSGFVFVDELNNPRETIFEGADPIRDGIKSANEIGIGGARINLTDGNGLNLVAFTDIDGRYEFQGLVGGSYQVELDEDDGLILNGVSQLTVSLGSNTASQTGVNFPLINTVGNGLDTVDILASTHTRHDDGDDGREGGLVALEPSGDQDFFVVFGGYEGVQYLELNLNAQQDAALLTILEDDGDLLSARLVAGEDFVVNDSGRGVQFFGGRDDHEFFEIDAGSEAEFDAFLDSINLYQN
jgi:hypothetical protein